MQQKRGESFVQDFAIIIGRKNILTQNSPMLINFIFLILGGNLEKKSNSEINIPAKIVRKLFPLKVAILLFIIK